MNCRGCILFIISFFTTTILFAQSEKKDAANNIVHVKTQDSVAITKQDSSVKKKHDPRIATRRSAIIPGWGQAYNRQYWKIPLVYGILAIPTSTFIFNNKYYKMTKFAYDVLYQATYGSAPGVPPTHADTLMLNNIDSEIRDGVINGRFDLATLQNARNQYRKNRDYSIFWFIIAWGLNVADATVSGHLKDFNITDDLSMHVRPTFTPETRSPGVSVVLNIKNPSPKTLKVSAR